MFVVTAIGTVDRAVSPGGRQRPFYIFVSRGKTPLRFMGTVLQ